MTRDVITKHLKYIFAILVIVGIAVILGFTRFQVPTEKAPVELSRHLLMIGIVVGLMFFYGVAVLLRRKSQYARESDGETFYYLGFIYTLATLVATFLPLLGTQTKPESKVVLGLFGLGLITTFVGLAGRVFFLQLTEDQPELEDEAAQRLGNAYVEAARAIEASTLQIAKAHAQADEHLRDAYSTTVKAIRTMAEQAEREYSRVTSEVGKQLTDMIEGASLRAESLLKALESRVLAMQLPPAKLGEQLEATLKDLVQRSQKMSQAMEAVEHACSALERGVSTALKTVSEGARALDGLGQVAGSTSTSIGRANESIETLVVRLTALSEMLQEVLKSAQHTQEIARSLDTLGVAIAEAQSVWKNFAATAALAEKSTATAVTAIGNFERSARSAAEAANNMGGSLYTLTDRSNTLVDTAERAGHVAQSMVDTQLRLSGQITIKLTELIKQYNDAVKTAEKLQEDVRASEDAVKQVHQNLIDASRFIIEQIR